MKKQIMIIIILAILLVGTFGYLGYNKYTEYKQTEQIELVQYGYSQALMQIAQMASKCEVIPLNIGNQTINLIAIECLGEKK